MNSGKFFSGGGISETSTKGKGKSKVSSLEVDRLSHGNEIEESSEGELAGKSKLKFGKLQGPNDVEDKEIVWPPMVVIMNPPLENDEWKGMGDHQLLDYISSYNVKKVLHSDGTHGQEGMRVLVFEASALGYLEAERLNKHFEDQGTNREAWDCRWVPFLPGGQLQLYGYMAEKGDLDIFNQHSSGKSKLEFDMRSYRETVVSQMKQMSEDKQRTKTEEIDYQEEIIHNARDVIENSFEKRREEQLEKGKQSYVNSSSTEDDHPHFSGICSMLNHISLLAFTMPCIHQVLAEKTTFIINLVEEFISPGTMERRRNQQWNQWVEGEVDGFKYLIASKSRVLRDHIRHGVPCSLRNIVWPLLLGSDQLMLENRELFQDLSNREALCNPKCIEVINLDHTRCGENLDFFKEEFGQQTLRKILIAYTLYDHEHKYTQGMGFLAAILLVQITNPEQAFWAYVALMKGFSTGRTRIAAFFEISSSDSKKALVDQCIKRFNTLLCKLLPKFWKRLQEEYLDTSFTIKWFMRIFSSFPLYFTSRIWDVVLFEGFDIVFFVALALLKYHEKQLLEMDGIEFTNALRDFHEIFSVDADAILQLAWSIQQATSFLWRWS